jgi:hypothetical protein
MPGNIAGADRGSRMWIEIKPTDQNDEQKKIGVQPYAVDLHFTDRMVRLGSFFRYEGDEGFVIRNLYREGGTSLFPSCEDAADAIAEYQMGRAPSKMIPIHLRQDVPD